ncbi:cytochrome P450 [Rhodococcus sp. NPDC059968]|uniref:cytochrome P450 n=1 Tax=Rhodococcus sp. NPDC059968 TaxID=3347017 RepID=UPI00366B8EB8
MNMPQTYRTPTASEIDLSDPQLWQSPRATQHEVFAVLRNELPISRHKPPTPWAPAEYPPGPYWAVTRHEDIQAITSDVATFSNERGTAFAMDGVPLINNQLQDGFLASDPPRHSKMRRIVSKAFTPKVMKNIEGWIEEQARGVVSAVADRGECDFHHEISAPFSFGVICDMVGAPVADRAWIARTGNLMGFSGDIEYQPSTYVTELVESVVTLSAFGADLSRSRRKSGGGDDLLGSLIEAEVDGERLSDEEIGSLFYLLLSAGTETTAATAAHGMHALTTFPDERRRWQSNFEGLSRTAVEEILRWGSAVQAFRRTAVTDTTIGGQEIAAGDTVCLFFVSSNFDETVFDDPLRFDLGRKDNPHHTFGARGIHYCLGNVLSRTELKILYRELFQQLPDLRMTGDPVLLDSPVFATFRSAPCAFTPVKAGAK